MTPGRRSQILLADDNASTIHLLAAEVDIWFALAVPDALGLVDEMPPDLILLDIEMHGENDLEFYRALLNVARLAQMPVLVLPSPAQLATEFLALQQGAADFTARPVISSQVLARVRAQSFSLRPQPLADDGAGQATLHRPTQARRLPASADPLGRGAELKACPAWHLGRVNTTQARVKAYQKAPSKARGTDLACVVSTGPSSCHGRPLGSRPACKAQRPGVLAHRACFGERVPNDPPVRF